MVVAWATLGVLAATLVASFFYLGNKIDALGAELRGAISAQGADLRGAIAAQGVDLGARIDALTARVDGLNTRLDNHVGGHRHAG